MSSWSAVRKIWVKPEVYPLIGAMGLAVGGATFAMISKVKRDPFFTFNKAHRSGTEDVFASVDEVRPFGAPAKSGSIRIFGKENEIMSNKYEYTSSPPPVTVRIGEEEEEEAEEDASAGGADAEADGGEAQVVHIKEEVEDVGKAVVDSAVAAKKSVETASHSHSHNHGHGHSHGHSHSHSHSHDHGLQNVTEDDAAFAAALNAAKQDAETIKAAVDAALEAIEQPPQAQPSSGTAPTAAS